MSLNVDLVFQIAIIGIVVSVLNIVLRQSHKEEWAQMLTIAGAVVVLSIVARMVLDLFQTVRTMFQLY
ncbi:MAG: stage III sporulation protein AC [Bacillota bacterium]|jgi:stage III sporulation protein AC